MICRKCGKDLDPSSNTTELCSDCSEGAPRHEREPYDQSLSISPGFTDSSDGYIPWEDEQRIGFQGDCF